MTWNKRAFPAVALAFLIASPAAAQVAGRPYEISGQAGALVFDSRAFTRNGPAAAATLGWRAFPWITLEAQGMAGIGRVDTLRTKENVKFATFGLDLRWNLRPADSRVVPYVLTGGAYALSNVVGHAPTNLERGSGSLGLGALYNIAGPRTYLRLQARDVFFREREALEFSNHFALTAGIQYVLGGKFHDQDLDGVRDWLARCPDTPIGAKVDAHGCPVDTDGDGVFDGLDKCADTPKGCKVDPAGCPIDSDGDGVCDGIDECADTPKGATVDSRGCPHDADGDAVLDGLDKCEGTTKGCVVDANGCPKDSDNDGVCDGLDQCPDTPAGLKVDQNGCPIEVIEKETELLDTGMIRLQDINFETDKADLMPESLPRLDAVGLVLVRWPELKIEIGGHTDSRGSDAKNQKLSEARAKAVADYLLKKFPALKPEQYTVKGYGEKVPIASNKTPEGMALNRRVEFVVQNKDVLKREIEKRHLLEQGEGTPGRTPVPPDTTRRAPPPTPAPPDTMRHAPAPGGAPPDTTKK